MPNRRLFVVLALTALVFPSAWSGERQTGKPKGKKMQKLELTWVGKDDPISIEPRILIEDAAKSNTVLDSDTGNMLVHGDNLLALKALEAKYAGQVKCIYIDPPYNTGAAFEHYDDNLEHSIWLGLMRARLCLLRQLLSEDGSIWISIDDDEQAYMKVMCDEIFGRQNFVATVVWQKRTSPDNRLRLGDAHDYILVYQKQKGKWSFNQVPMSEERVKGFKNPDNDPRGPWASTDCTAQAGHGVPSQFYTLITPAGREITLPKGLCWRYTKEKMDEEIKAGRIWFGKDGKGVPRKKTYLADRTGQNSWTWWTNAEVGHNQEAKKEINALFGADNPFDTPKPERLILRILTLASNPGDLVLDSFLGSGTTAAVAHKMGRRWIGIEMGDHAYTHCKARLDKVVSGDDKGGISKSVEWKGGGGYRFYELAPTLIRFDDIGEPVINEKYDAEMLATAVALHEGFVYAPDAKTFWKQAVREKDGNAWLFTTTRHISRPSLAAIAQNMKKGEYLVVVCKSFDAGAAKDYPNITVKKIPPALLGKCEFGKDGYPLNIYDAVNVVDDGEWEEDGDEG